MYDLALSPTFDLVPDGMGGLATVTGVACDFQDATYRVLLNDPDQQLWQIGANLEDLAGQPNSAAAGAVGEQSIAQALTTDGRFSNVSVSSVPVAANAIEFDVSWPSPLVNISASTLTVVMQLESSTTSVQS